MYLVIDVDEDFEELAPQDELKISQNKRELRYYYK
jgi:hypothetical protein